jgi:hypothetical protein
MGAEVSASITFPLIVRFLITGIGLPVVFTGAERSEGGVACPFTLYVEIKIIKAKI